MIALLFALLLSLPNEIYFFTAPWCGPCQQMKPVMQQLRAEGYIVRTFDADSELAAKFNVTRIPCTIIMENGREVKRYIGVKPASEIKSGVKTLMEQ